MQPVNRSHTLAVDPTAHLPKSPRQPNHPVERPQVVAHSGAPRSVPNWPEPRFAAALSGRGDSNPHPASVKSQGAKTSCSAHNRTPKHPQIALSNAPVRQSGLVDKAPISRALCRAAALLTRRPWARPPTPGHFLHDLGLM